MDAFRLVNINQTECTFEKGQVPNLERIHAKYFFIDMAVDGVNSHLHPAPRDQYVVTLKGKLEFKVTNGDTFTIEPGIILVAEDINGPGHSWRILEGDEWQRIYIVPDPEALVFVPDPKI